MRRASAANHFFKVTHQARRLQVFSRVNFHILSKARVMHSIIKFYCLPKRKNVKLFPDGKTEQMRLPILHKKSLISKNAEEPTSVFTFVDPVNLSFCAVKDK